jgi:hypothetical protein
MRAIISAFAGAAITPGEAERITAVVDTFCPVDRDERLRVPLQARRARLARSSCGATGFLTSSGVSGSTFKGDFAADLLQMQQREIFRTGRGCTPIPLLSRQPAALVAGAGQMR